MAPNNNNILVIGVSGVSSSGKTTLSRLLRDVFPDSFILHEDDFYWSDQDIPVKNGVQDWDCVEAIDLKQLQRALEHVKENGTIPPDLDSKEDQNSVGESGVSEEDLEPFKEKSRQQLLKSNNPTRIVLMDGFLLYSEKMKEIRQLFDVKLFLMANLETVKARRNARSGYVTLEGFWEDPPGYVEDVVWPNYVEEHAFLFEHGNVEGELNRDRCLQLGIHGIPAKAQTSMKKCLEWAFDIIRSHLD